MQAKKKNIDIYEHNGFKYIKDHNDVSSKGAIIEHNKKKPENLFKFYAFNNFSIDALINSYLYASHPFELNDTLDSSPFLLYTSKSIKFSFYENFLGPSYKDKRELQKFYKNDAYEKNLCKGYISTLWEITSNIFGIISMTGKENNPLMWPHYTQEKGFQIKFNTTKLEKSINDKITQEEYLGLHPINYSENVSPIDISPYKTNIVPFYYATNVKSDKWKYEDEWRFFISKHHMGVPFSKTGLNPRSDWSVKKENRFTYYEKSLIKEITLGHNYFNGREFKMEWLDENKIKVEPIKSKDNWNYDNHLLFLNYITENLADKLYYSGVKYELDDDKKPYLIRTKERMELEKIEENSFVIKRTYAIIKLF